MTTRTRKILPLALLLAGVAAGTLQAANFSEDFENVPALFSTGGWVNINKSDFQGTNPTWGQGSTAVFPGQTGGYAAANFNATTGASTISLWMLTPQMTFLNNDTITFYTRTTTGQFPDRLELRLSLAGASTNVGATSTSVGDFTTLLLTVNPNLTTTGYPTTFTQYTVTISGLSGPTTGRLGFRYFVTNGGPSGANSDYIGVDTLRVVPEPSTTALIGLAGLGAAALIIRRRRVA